MRPRFISTPVFFSFWAAGFLAAIISCEQDYSGDVSIQFDFPDILNIKNIPQQSEDGSAFCFFDLGSRHGFALPPDSSKEFLGSFIGPFSVTHKRWLSRSLARLHIYDLEKEIRVNFTDATDLTNSYYPGILRREFKTSGMNIRSELIFASSRTALIRTRIKNDSEALAKLKISWTGDAFHEQALFQQIKNGVALTFAGEKSLVAVRIPYETPGKVTISIDAKSYTLTLADAIELAPNEVYTLCLTQSLLNDFDAMKDEEELIRNALQSHELFFYQNAKRWDGYLKRIIGSGSKGSGDKENQKIAVKSLLKLINNGKSPIK